MHPPGANGALPNYYPVDIFQMYVDTYLPNLGPKGSTVRVGRFATHLEYELVQGAENSFLSRSYLFQYNPFTHTGFVGHHAAQRRLDRVQRVGDGGR